MESEILNLTSLICDTINHIFFKIFSSIDNTMYSNLDSILFIHSDILQDMNFQKMFGTDSSNGLLLLANSLIFGILLFYALKFAISHLTYSKIDFPYQFIFKCIIFVACMNSSLWLCEKLIEFISFISDFINKLGNSITGYEINFSTFINYINSALYSTLETFDIFSFDGLLKILSTFGFLYIFLSYSVRYIMCKILVLLSPFAFLTLIHNQLDGFFKGWLKQFLILLLMQIFVSIVLTLGFCLSIYAGNSLFKIFYLAILVIIARCNYYLKEIFSHIYKFSKNQLNDFI